MIITIYLLMFLDINYLQEFNNLMIMIIKIKYSHLKKKEYLNLHYPIYGYKFQNKHFIFLPK